MNKLSLAALGILSIVFGTSSLANAASLTETEFSLEFSTNDPPANLNGPFGICSFVGICNPGVERLLPDLNPGIATSPQLYINDTGFPITGIFAKLPKNRPEGLGVFVAGSSTIFSDINISNDKQELSFTGGIIAVNEVIIGDFETDPESDSTLFLTLTTTAKPSSTPEPSSLVGTIVFGFIGTCFWFQKKQNLEKHKQKEIHENL